MNSPAPPRRRLLRRFLQFRIRTMLILMTLVAIGLSVYFSYLQHYEEQQEAAAALAARGVTLEWEPMRPAWLRNLLSHRIDEKLLRDCVTVHGRAHGLKDDDLVHLQGLKHLKNLYLERNRITDEGLAHLSQLRKLERLSLWGNAITDDGLRHLASLPALEVLDIHGVKPNAISGFVVTSGSRSIDKLNVNQFYKRAVAGPLTPSCLEHLKEIGSLRALDFSFAVDEEGLQRLATFPRLRVRTLIVRTVSLDRLAPLRRLPDLETLVLDRCWLDPEAVLYLANLPRLANLELRDTEVNDGAELSQLVQLKQLSVVDAPLGDRAFAALGRLKGLESLWLSGTGATDANIAHLGGCTNLELLDLGGEKLTADALNNLGSLKRLSKLVIDRIPLDDEVVHSLVQMDGLTQIGSLRRNSPFSFYLSPAGVAELADSLCPMSFGSINLLDAGAGATLPGVDVPPKATTLSDDDLACLWEAPPYHVLRVASPNLTLGTLRWKPELASVFAVVIVSQRPADEVLGDTSAFTQGSVSLNANRAIFKANPGLGPRTVELQWPSPTCPLDLLEKLPNIRRLTLTNHNHPKPPGCDWSQLRHVPDLETLVVEPQEREPLALEAIRQIGEMAGLRRLECFLPDDLPPEEFARLGNLTQLEHLTIRLNGLKPEHLPTLGKLVNLKSLLIRGEPGEFEGPLGANHLLGLTQLSELELAGVNDEDLSSLARLTSLTSLSFPHDKASDAAYRQLAALPALKTLRINSIGRGNRRSRIRSQLPSVNVR